jgi:hypothetical protein
MTSQGPPGGGAGGGRLPRPENAHDRWIVSAALISHSGGLAVVEFIVTNQLLGVLPAYRLTLEWKAGMEQEDVEARALAVAGQSLAYLRQAMIDEAVAKVS